MTSVEIRHTGKIGSNNGYEKFSCRCDECITAHEVYLDRKRARHGVTKRILPDFEHGTLRRYQSPRFKCRCQPCKDANAAYKREKWQLVNEDVPQQLAGTESLKAKTAPILKLRGGIAPSDRTFELTPVTDCGEELPNGGFCRRLFPCQIHPIGP